MTPLTNTPQAGRKTAAGTADHAWHLVLGLTLWFVWFCATYGGLAVACAVVPPPAELGPMNWLNAAVLLLAAACTCAFGRAAWVIGRGARGRVEDAAGSAGAGPCFIACTASALYATAAFSTVLVALPAVLLTPCV